MQRMSVIATTPNVIYEKYHSLILNLSQVKFSQTLQVFKACKVSGSGLQSQNLLGLF